MTKVNKLQLVVAGSETQLLPLQDYYRAVAAVVAETAATGGGPSTAPPSRRQFEPWERFPMDGPPYRPAPGMAMNGAGKPDLLQRRSTAPYILREQAVVTYSLIWILQPRGHTCTHQTKASDVVLI